jgi:hypothetical protein
MPARSKKILLGDRVEVRLVDFLTDKTPHPWVLERFFLDLRLGFLITCLVRTAPLLLFMLGWLNRRAIICLIDYRHILLTRDDFDTHGHAF